MKNFYRLSAALLTVGMMGAAACSSCSPAPEDASSSPAMQQQSYRCGPNTHREGNQCVADAQSTSSRNAATKVLKTTGNN